MENNEQLKRFPVVYRKTKNVVISFEAYENECLSFH